MPADTPGMAPGGAFAGRVGPTPTPAPKAPQGPSASSEGHPRRRAPARLGCAPPKAAPSNYATPVLRKSRNSKCELGLIFVKSGLRSQLEQLCERFHTRRGSRATMWETPQCDLHHSREALEQPWKIQFVSWGTLARAGLRRPGNVAKDTPLGLDSAPSTVRG